MTYRLHMPLLVVIPIVALFVLAYWFFVAVPAAAAPSRLSVAGHPFLVEVADTRFKQIKGLSGRPLLAADHGMLFPFDEGIHAMWMPNMKFAIDLLWIRDGRIVEIATLNPPTPARPIPETYTPLQMSDRVLEIPAGTVKRLGIEVGDEVSDVAH